MFRARGEHRYSIPDGSRWGDVLAASTHLGETLTDAMRAVSNANDELRGVFTVDWAQPAPDGSGKPLIPNEVVHALIQHFNAHDLSNAGVPPDVLGQAYEYLIKQFADDAGAKAGEFFTPPEVVDTLVCAFWLRATGPESQTRTFLKSDYTLPAMRAYSDMVCLKAPPPAPCAR